MKKNNGKTSKIAGLMALSIWLCIAACTSQPNTAPHTENVAGKQDPLSSWNEGASKKAILDYVKTVTDTAGSSFIPPAERVATFDNDGTLWSEKPAYFQFFFAVDRLKAMSAAHPEWKNKQPYKAVLDNDMKALLAQGEKGLLQVVMATHAGMTTDEFESIVSQWISTARHPQKNRLYTELVFEPMIQLIKYLQDNQFKVYIVSGGGIEFMRPWAEKVYGIPRDRVIGSSIKTAYDYHNGNPSLKRLPEINFIDDKSGKPVGINQFIGRKPVFACGNSDGDLQMLQWTASNPLRNFELLVHHTDSVREWSYDRNSMVGALDKAWDEAKTKGWTIVDMQKDWAVIYPFESR